MSTLFEKTQLGEVDEVVLRTSYAFNKATSVGQRIMIDAFQIFKKINGLSKNQDFDFTENQESLFSKEIAKLSLFWLTRDIWTYIVTDEQKAKKANLLLCSWFKEKYNVECYEIEEYAKAVGTSEEVKIFGKNIARIFNCYGAVEIFELNTIPIKYFKEHLRNTKNAFELSISKIKKDLNEN